MLEFVLRISNFRKFVRLGEYNLDDNPDCIQELDEEDCADPPMDFPVARKFVHPRYEPRSQNHHHDIAILKLRQPAAYTPFIRPICLPQTKGQPFNTFYVAGWGRTGFNAPPSPYKMRVQLPYVETQTCARVYRTERLEITTGQICAGGKKGYDACLGDSGSPLMYTKNGARWELVGVVSLGFKNCGLEGVPGVYTYVHNYMDWINSNIVD
jgi:secreted trypsin-like serine protease